MVSQPDLQLLFSFLAVADSGSFTAAAESLHLSQPAVSRHVRRLEEQLGCLLLRRTARGVEVTDQGAQVLAGVRSILGELASLESLLARDRHPKLRIASTSGPLVYWLPDLLRRYERSGAAERLVVTEEGADQIIGGLLSGRFDVGIMNLPPRPGLRVVPLLEEPLVAIVPPEHRLGGRRSITLPELQSETFILLAPGQPFSAALNLAFQRAGVRPYTGYWTTSSEVCCQLVAAGLGVSVVPAMCAQRHLPRLSSLEIVPSLRRTLGAVYLHDTPSVQRFIRFLRRCRGPSGADPRAYASRPLHDITA